MDNQLIITIIILLLICLLFLVAYIESKKIPQKKKSKIYQKLEEIKIQTKSVDVFARRDAIIKLDNLLSKSFNIRYSNDSSCGENLKLAKKLFDKKQYQQLWDVHKLRNEIVHKDIDVNQEEAIEAYKIYKMGIRKILR